MKEGNEYPILSINKKLANGNISKENIYLKTTDIFFNNLKNEEISQENKCLILEELIKNLKINRYISEFFSIYDKESIYIFLFKLYLNNSTNNALKESIINLIKELSINLEINNTIYDFLFQKLAYLYRKEDIPTSEKLLPYLELLNAILGETENIIKPRNYFACSGNCKFELNIDSRIKLDVGYALTFILNFKIGMLPENSENEIISNLVKIEFSNGYELNIDLKYPVFLIVKKIRDNFIKTLPNDDWINLIINLFILDNTPTLYFFVNGENHLIPFKLPVNSISNQDYIKNIIFFNNFYGEVVSIIMLSHKENTPSSLNSNEFLLFFKQYKEGFWKKKKFDNLIEKLKNIESIGTLAEKSLTFQQKISNPLLLLDNKIEITKYLYDNLVFIFTPFSSSFKQNGLIENCLSDSNYKIKYNGNIRLHNYFCYQNKLFLIKVITNIFPIAEMFLIYPDTLNENNFEIFLKILENMLKFRKHNIEYFKKCRAFSILSLFIEKYPKKYFTEKILNSLSNIGKAIFSTESLCSTYFKYILLNEKILSKYTEDLQIKFWEQIMLFCKADRTQIEKFINMNRLCLILRYYDRNKYTEMCCKNHLDSIKEEFIGKDTVMNPPMNHILEGIKGIMDIIINGTDPKNAISLFKLLTLDLSPCLTKFIINTFLMALKKETNDNNWKDNFVIELIDSKFEVIMMNTFIHSLLEIRIDILTLIFEIYKRLTAMHRGSTKILENMLKTCLIPQKMFYFVKKDISVNNNNDQNKNNNKNNESFISNKEKISNMLKERMKNTNNIPNSKVETINNEILIFKDKLYEDYKDKILHIFLLWSLGENIYKDFNTFDIKQCLIKNANILEILFSCAEKLNDSDFTLKFIQYLELLLDKEQNAYIILLNKKSISSILDITFNLSKSEDKKIKNIYYKSKSLISNIFNNTINYLEKSKIMYPFDGIDTSLFLWGDNIIMKESNNKILKDNIFNFLNDILLEILTSFKVKFEPKMNFSINNPDFNPKNNFFLKNYFIIITHLFRFNFLYKYDPIIVTDEISFLPPSPKINNSLNLYISSMRVFTNKGKTINQQWAEYPFFDDIYKRLSSIWNKKNIFKNIKIENQNNKVLKYQEILEKIILNKENKNAYMKELNILTYEETIENKEYIIPLIKVISISLMCVLSASINNTDFLYWLKEFKYFIIFIIIASTNLTRKEQLDYYNSIQQKCINVLISCLTFLKELTLTNPQYQIKIENTYKRILLFCFLLMKYQYKYNQSHKINLLKKLNKNDLVGSSVFILFSEKIKDKSNNPIITFKKVDKVTLDDFNIICEEMKSKELNDILYENNIIKEQLDTNFFCIKTYKIYVDNRYKLFQTIKSEQDDKYKEDILVLLPLYEKELAKYSNNSLEKNKKIKKFYKKYKKESFSWRGYWSDRNLFFNLTNKLKLKIVNHYTKNFMKPILSPIIDMDYYLPEFSLFNSENLFNIDEKNKNKSFKLTIDMDKIFNSVEENKLQLNNDIEKNKENFLRNIYIKSNPELSNNLKKISNNLDFGRKEEFAFIKKSKEIKNDEVITNKYFLACLVKPSHHIKGVIFIDNDDLIFKVFLNQKAGNAMNNIELAFTTSDDDYDQDRQTCFGSYFVCNTKDKDIFRLSINYNNIKFLLRRRYYYKNSAIEIYTSTNKTYYFNFKYEKDREIIINEIIKKLKDYARILDDLKEPKDIFDNVVGYQNNLIIKVLKSNGKPKKRIKLSKKILAWKEWKMSTFELLMWANIYANRSYNDISQYPVFPWILSSYEDPLKNSSNDYNYRDLSLPMGMMELNEKSQKRKELYMETYDVLKNETDGTIKPFIFGSNYSNPMYVCNFMMRIFPFTHISVELQGSKFDDANRLFLSVKNSFFNSITEKMDVRELIPEFFYLPEIFININDINFGVEENGNKVNDVLTPCKNNPYEFIRTMKTILENDIISNNIQNWIDLIFGYKSKGKEAELSHNLFSEASYQEDININEIEDKVSFFRRVEFGLIPTQILTKECSKRDKKNAIYDKQITSSSCKLTFSMTKNSYDKNDYNIKDDSLVLKVKSIALDKIFIVLNNNTLIEKKISYSIFDGDYKDEIAKKIDLGKEMNEISEFYSYNSDNNKNIEICNQGKMVIMGGFYDGKIIIKIIGLEPTLSDKNKIEIIPFNDDSIIVSVAVDDEEKYLFLGNSKGGVALYKMNLEEKSFDKLLILSDQKTAISHIHCNSKMNLWISSSIDGYINIYTLPLCKLVRIIKVQSKLCSYSFLISSPLPSIVTICDESNNSDIFVYSINGKLISKKQEYFKLNRPIIIKDANFNEYMAYLGNHCVYIAKLPNLELVANISKITNSHIICCNEDSTILYALNKNGCEVNVIKDENKKSIRPSSIVIKSFGKKL